MLVGAGSPAEQVSFSAFELFVDAKTVIGCVYGSTDADRDFPVLVDLVRQGAIDAEGLVTRRIGLDDVNDAFRAMEAGEVARSVIVYDDAGEQSMSRGPVGWWMPMPMRWSPWSSSPSCCSAFPITWRCGPTPSSAC